MISTRRMIQSILTLLLGVGFAACGSDDSYGPGGNGITPPTPTPPATASVNVRDNFFDPSSGTVSSGTTVTWTWVSVADPYTGIPTSHSVTFDDGVGSSATQSSGTHTRQLNQTGTFTYFCSVHGKPVMSGEIVVQ